MYRYKIRITKSRLWMVSLSLLSYMRISEPISIALSTYFLYNFIEESNEVPNQSGRSDSTAGPPASRRSCEQQSSEASSSGNNLRAQSASITSNQSSVPLQFNRRPSTISPLNRQQNQQLLLVRVSLV